MVFITPPEPNYDRDIDRLLEYYRKAVRDIVYALTTADINDIDAKNRTTLLRQIAGILRELDANAEEWIRENIPKSYLEGQAGAMVALGVASNIPAAIQQLGGVNVGFTGINKHFVNAIIDDTFGDLLQATQNTERKVKQTVREVVAEQMRAKAAKNLGRKTMNRDVIKELREKLGEAGQFAITDRAGRNWTIENYVKVVVKTKIQQAHIEGVRNESIGRGAYYAVISSHGATDACRFHEGRIIKLTPDAPGDYPTYEQLRNSNQIFHPYCRHTVHALRDPMLLPASLREKAEKQAERGNAALATGKRNPKDVN